MFGFGNKNKLSQEDAYNQLQEDNSIVVIDVRNPDEFVMGHIEGAVNIPMTILTYEMENTVQNKDQKIFVNCLSGGRSKASCSIIEGMGYTNVHDIGGVATWQYGLTK